MFKSTDGGANWSAGSIGSSTLVVQALAIDPVTPTMLYAGTDSGGVFRSTDGGVNWRAANNPYYGGAYKTTGTVAINVLLNCYSEAGEGYGSELVAPTLVLGGLHGDGASPISNAGLIDVARSGAIIGLLQKGPIEYAVRTIAPVTNTVVNIGADDSIIFVDGSRAGFVLVLPDLTPPAPRITGRKFTAKRVDDPTNNPHSVFFEVLGGGTIDGKTTYPPNPFNGETFSGTVTFVADETEYKIVQQENDAIGQTRLLANTSSVTVNTTAATPTSTILLTPLDNPEGHLWITRAAGSFTIKASVAPTRDVPIAYLIKNE